jgi:hypothetical protein
MQPRPRPELAVEESVLSRRRDRVYQAKVERREVERSEVHRGNGNGGASVANESDSKPPESITWARPSEKAILRNDDLEPVQTAGATR